MRLGKVEKKSKFYALLKGYFQFMFDKVFYGKVEYSGMENIPDGKPVLFAPNHQNALMDPLALIFSSNRQIVFLARSDIFKSKIVSRLLFLVKILPVYRIRDGKEKLKLNEIIFDKTVEILEKNRPVAIFPEARHFNKRHLKPLKKGIQRVAFAAAEKNNYQLDIKIVPVGIYYSNYWNFKATIQVQYGKPISVSKYYELYKEDKAKAMVALREDLSAAIKKLIIDIRDLKEYDTYEQLRDICDWPVMKSMGYEAFTQKEKFIADKAIIRTTAELQKENPKEYTNLKSKVTTYSESLEKYRLSDSNFEKPMTALGQALRIIMLVVASPVWLYGLLNNIFTLLIFEPVKKKIKDRQFESSFVFALGALSFPLFYLIQTFIMFSFTNWIWALAYLVSLPVSGLLAFSYTQVFKKVAENIRLRKIKNSPKYAAMKELRTQIIDKIKLLSSV